MVTKDELDPVALFNAAENENASGWNLFELAEYAKTLSNIELHHLAYGTKYITTHNTTIPLYSGFAPEVVFAILDPDSVSNHHFAVAYDFSLAGAPATTHYSIGSNGGTLDLAIAGQAVRGSGFFRLNATSDGLDYNDTSVVNKNIYWIAIGT